MNKRALIRKIVAQLTSDLETYVRAARAAHAEATHEQSKAENKYDTRGLEASYLAHGQSRQAAEIEAAIGSFQRLDGRNYAPGEAVDLGALVEVEAGGERSLYFIGQKSGGTEVVQEKRPVLVVTPQSPLGGQLMGRKQGDVLLIHLAGTQNPHRITSVT
jgi:transcription elongation GreA/GreB family factor